MHCNGKCYLDKKLKEADDKEKSTERTEKKHFDEALITKNFHLSPPVNSFTNLRSYEAVWTISRYKSSIFQPPQA